MKCREREAVMYLTPDSPPAPHLANHHRSQRVTRQPQIRKEENVQMRRMSEVGWGGGGGGGGTNTTPPKPPTAKNMWWWGVKLV
uniref:Uncharacterized protein n=1 Tax=Knipowitschia caucasica TaxID=637954 RepID=A0AAV2LED2_KNICA